MSLLCILIAEMRPSGRARTELGPRPFFFERPLNCKIKLMTPLTSIGLKAALDLLREHSPPLARALAGRPGLKASLFEAGELERPLTGPEIEALLARPESGPETEEELFSRLRRAKEALFVRLALRDLLGLADLAEVVSTLSHLADLALSEALAGGLKLLLAQRGLPARPQDRPFFLGVLGLGKLGGLELNYASDIDLVYVYEPSLWPFEKQVQAAEAADWLGAFIGRALGQPTVEGLVFRVDLGLRPAGKDGPLVPSLEAARHYYLYRAADWERLALIKLRPVAGNIRLGQELFDETRPFVYRRHLDYSAIEELRQLKIKIAARPRPLTQTGPNLKLDRGGIRQVEFFVQTLQLIYGGRQLKIRSANTLEALSRLEEQGLISGQDRASLRAAYVFLRKAEHRLQLFLLQQTQSLPQSREDLDRLGRATGSGHPPALRVSFGRLRDPSGFAAPGRPGGVPGGRPGGPGSGHPGHGRL